MGSLEGSDVLLTASWGRFRQGVRELSGEARFVLGFITVMWLLACAAVAGTAYSAGRAHGQGDECYYAYLGHGSMGTVCGRLQPKEEGERS